MLPNRRSAGRNFTASIIVMLNLQQLACHNVQSCNVKALFGGIGYNSDENTEQSGNNSVRESDKMSRPRSNSP